MRCGRQVYCAVWSELVVSCGSLRRLKSSRRALALVNKLFSVTTAELQLD